MLDEVLAALKGADPFEAKYHVSEAEAQRILAEQWRELDRLAASDPAAYGRHLEAGRGCGAGICFEDGLCASRGGDACI